MGHYNLELDIRPFLIVATYSCYYYNDKAIQDSAAGFIFLLSDFLFLKTHLY